MSKFRPPTPSPALVISCLALFVALAGTAFAAGALRKNSVHSAQIADGSIRTPDIGNGAVTGGKIAPGAVGSDNLAGAAVGAAALADGSVGSGKLKDGAVGASDLAEIAQASVETAVPAQQSGSATVTCPAGTVVISGGADGGTFTDVLVVSERAGDGWHVETKNNGNTPAPLKAFAYCLESGAN